MKDNPNATTTAMGMNFFISPDGIKDAEPARTYEAGTQAYEAHLRKQSANAAEWQRNSSARIGVASAITSVAASWPESSMETTTIEDVLAKARAQEEQARRKETDELAAFAAENDDDMGTADAQPAVMDFFNGRSHSEGLELYNRYRAANGLGPVRKGAK